MCLISVRDRGVLAHGDCGDEGAGSGGGGFASEASREESEI